jgi:hypothetical protein
MPTPEQTFLNPLQRTCSKALALFGSCIALALIWAQFRGFDMLDGAFYFLLYQDPADYSDTQTRFHLLARPIWLLCGQNIIAFRFTTLALGSFACWLFWRALRRLLPRTNAASLYWWPLWLAAMAGLTWVPVALTYNSIAMLLSLFELAIVLQMLNPRQGGRLQRWIRPLMGLALVVLFYGIYLAKAPAAAVLFGSTYVLFCFDPRLDSRLRRVLLGVGLTMVALVAGAGLFVITRPGFGPNKVFLINGLLFTPKQLFIIFERYWAEVRHLFPAVRGDFLWTIGPMIWTLLVALFGISDNPRLRPWSEASLAVLLAAVAGALVSRRLWDCSFTAAVSGEAARFYFLLWGSLLPLWLVCLWRTAGIKTDDARQKAAWIIVMLALPLISSFGSTNTVYVSALHETVFWAAGLLLVSDCIATAFSAPWFRPAVAVLVSIAAAGQVFSGHFLRPYMYQPSLWKQTRPVETGFPPTKLRIDPDLAGFLLHIRAALNANGYKPGDDVFGFFNLPGVVFAVGAKEPGAPWYFGTWYHQENVDEIKLERVPLKRRQAAWIVTQADVRQFRPEFIKSGIDFPDSYTKIAQTINPVTGLEIGIWKPRGHP